MVGSNIGHFSDKIMGGGEVMGGSYGTYVEKEDGIEA
jgi:hypothetical protein